MLVPDAAIDGLVDAGEDAGVEETSIDMPDDRVHHAQKPGTISIDSQPFATIYVDGKPFGVTPILQKALPAGHHKLKAVLKDGRSRTLELDIPAGKSARPVVLSW